MQTGDVLGLHVEEAKPQTAMRSEGALPYREKERCNKAKRFGSPLHEFLRIPIPMLLGKG